MVKDEIESCRCLASRFLDRHTELWRRWIRFCDGTPAGTMNSCFRVFAWNTSFAWGQDRIRNGRDGSEVAVTEVHKIAAVADCRGYVGDVAAAVAVLCPSSSRISAAVAAGGA
jgi:hypothetical protein